MSDDKFKLPGSSYGQLVKIIKAYGHAPDNVAPKEVADIATIDQTEVSRNNGFLLGVGVVSGGNKKALTGKGRALAHALDYDLPSEIERSWKALVEESDFMRKVLAAIRVRGGMDPASIKAHIAFMAGQPNKGRALIGAGSVLEVLTAAGAIAEDDGKVVAIRLDDVPAHTAEEPDRAATLPSKPVRTEVFEHLHTVPAGPHQVQVLFRINVDCTPEQLPDLASSLRAALDTLSGQESEPGEDA